MSSIVAIAEKIKAMQSAIASMIGIVVAIGGCVFYVENNFANAQDVKDVVKNQNIQIRQNLMFQLEYYDDKIKKLELEKSRNEELLKDSRVTATTRAYTRKPEDIKDEVQELKMRRDIIRQDLINSQNRASSK